MVEINHPACSLLPCTCRAGRALLDWTQEDLATASGVSRSTVREFENGHHYLHAASEAAIIAALVDAGVTLVSLSEGPGVVLRSPPAAPPRR